MKRKSFYIMKIQSFLNELDYKIYLNKDKKSNLMMNKLTIIAFSLAMFFTNSLTEEQLYENTKTQFE